MIKPGEKQSLTVKRFSPHGAYLTDNEENEVLLPNRYVTHETIEGTDVEVFVYHDSEDRLVASTDMPYVMVGEIALLQVVDTNRSGAFLDWGLPKDLFIPLANQSGRLLPGKFVLVTLYVDNVSGRVVATAKLNRLVNNTTIELQPKEKVDIIIAERNDLGYRVIINNRNWGMIYHNQIFIDDIRIGDIMTGYIVRVTEDHRIDVSLQPLGVEQVEDSSTQIFSILQEAGGHIAIGDKSEPEEIYKTFQMSKKMFKRGVGSLWKQGKIEIGDYEITLKQK